MQGQGFEFDELKALLTGEGSEDVARRVVQLLEECPGLLISDLLNRFESEDNSGPLALNITNDETLVLRQRVDELGNTVRRLGYAVVAALVVAARSPRVCLEVSTNTSIKLLSKKIDKGISDIDGKETKLLKDMKVLSDRDDRIIDVIIESDSERPSKTATLSVPFRSGESRIAARAWAVAKDDIRITFDAAHSIIGADDSIIITLPPGSKEVGKAKDACSKTNPIRVASLHGDVEVNPGQSKIIELPTTTNEIYWYCGISRGRLAKHPTIYARGYVSERIMELSPGPCTRHRPPRSEQTQDSYQYRPPADDLWQETRNVPHSLLHRGGCGRSAIVQSDCTWSDRA